MDNKADALSKQTTLAGLPKAARLTMKNTVAGGAVGHVTALMDTITYNYGGFPLKTSGGYYTGFYIPESGIYEVKAQHAFVANSQNVHAIFLRHNGVDGGAPDGCTVGVIMGWVMLNNSALHVSTLWELKAGDSVEFTWYQGSSPNNSILPYTHLSIKKEGGAY